MAFTNLPSSAYWSSPSRPITLKLFFFPFLNYVGMLLQPVMAGLPGGPQTDKETNKQAKNKTKYTHS